MRLRPITRDGGHSALTSPGPPLQINCSPSLTSVPIIDLFLRLVFLIAVSLLNFAFELISLPVDHVEIVISELSPLLFDLAFDLLPVSLDLGSNP